MPSGGSKSAAVKAWKPPFSNFASPPVVLIQISPDAVSRNDITKSPGNLLTLILDFYWVAGQTAFQKTEDISLKSHNSFIMR
jgi:hypothetical protein